MFGIGKDEVKGAIEGVLKPLGDTIDNVHTSKEEKKKLKNKYAEIQNKMTSKVLNFKEETMKAKRDVLVQDAKSEHWLLANWRPITILGIIGVYLTVVVNNHIVAPYLPNIAEQLTMPQELGGIVKRLVSLFTFGKSLEIGAGRLSNSHNSDKETFK